MIGWPASTGAETFARCRAAEAHEVPADVDRIGRKFGLHLRGRSGAGEHDGFLGKVLTDRSCRYVDPDLLFARSLFAAIELGCARRGDHRPCLRGQVAVDGQLVAAGDAAGRVQYVHMCGSVGFWIERTLHGQWPNMPTTHEAGLTFLEFEPQFQRATPIVCSHHGLPVTCSPTTHSNQLR